MVDVNLSVPEGNGPGKPGTATPEQPFAAGDVAYLGGALDFIAKQHRKTPRKGRSNAPSPSVRHEKGARTTAREL